MEHNPVVPKAAHVPEGKTGITPEAECLCCRVSLEHLEDHKGCESWYNSYTVLAG